MKKFTIVTLILLLASLIFLGCNNDDSDAGLVDQDGSNLTFSQTIEGKVMRVVISRNPVPDTSRNVITPQNNDHYRIWLAGESISHGRIERGVGSVIIFIPSSGARFEGTLSGSALIIPTVPLPDGGSASFTALQGTSPGAGTIGTNTGTPSGNATLQITKVGEDIYTFLRNTEAIAVIVFSEKPSKNLASHAFSAATTLDDMVDWIDAGWAAVGGWQKGTNPSSWPISINIDLIVSENTLWSGGSDHYLTLVYKDTEGRTFLHALTVDAAAYNYNSGDPNLLAYNFTNGVNSIDWYDIVDVKFAGSPATVNNQNSVLSEAGSAIFPDGKAELDIVYNDRVVDVVANTDVSFTFTPKARGTTTVILLCSETGFELKLPITVAHNYAMTGHDTKFKFALDDDYQNVVVSTNTVTIASAAFDFAVENVKAVGSPSIDVIEANISSGAVVLTITGPGFSVITVDDDDDEELIFVIDVDEFGLISFDYDSDLDIGP